MNDLYEVLCASELAPDHTAAAVGRIVSEAREQNARDGIGGLLVFDGQRFCHHFEGSQGKALELLERLRGDRRHQGLRVLYEGALPQRRYARFELGLAPVDADDPLELLVRLQGPEALSHFLRLRPRFDVPG